MGGKDYRFDHRCDAMPDEVSFLQLSWSSRSQFTVETSEPGTVKQRTVLYGFRYCPYCGKDMEVDA